MPFDYEIPGRILLIIKGRIHPKSLLSLPFTSVVEQALKMRLLLLTCLVASVFAAPSEKTKRNILPGDPRYDAKHHDVHDEHEHHENEVEIAKALGGFTGSFAVPDVGFGSSGLETGTSIGSTDFSNHDLGASKAAVVFDAVKVGSGKVSEELRSVTESSFSVPKVESVTIINPSSSAVSDIATSTESYEVVSRTKDDKESFKSTDQTKIENKSASDKTSSDFSKTIIGSGAFDAKLPIAEFSSDLSLATDSLATPYFGPSFDSSFSSPGRSGYSPSFQSTSEFNTPSFGGFNTNYDYYNSNGGAPLRLDAYSGFDQSFNGHAIRSNIPVGFSQPNPIDFIQNVPYPSSSSFHSFNTGAEVSPSQFKFGNVESLLSSPVGSEYQQHIFKNYNSFPLSQPTSASFHAKFQPEIKIAQGSYPGIGQQTDSNGGYVY